MHISKKSIPIIAVICSAFIVGGAAISANNTNTETEEKTEVIAFQTTTNYDDTKREGTIEVQQEGKAGSKKVVYAVTYRDGKEIERKKQSEEIIEPAQDEIVIKGTKKYYTCSNGVEYETQAEQSECEKRIKWEETKNASLQQCYNDSSKFNCWYDEYPGTTIHYEYYTAPSSRSNTSAPQTTKNGRTGAVCNDGTYSSATGRGACSHHGGVSQWLY